MVAGTGRVTGGSVGISRLDEADPGAGVTILYDGQEWRVTGQASYTTEEGYRVHEWCCEVGETMAYDDLRQDTMSDRIAGV